VHGRVKAEGDLANQPLTLDGRFARNADGGILVPAFRGNWASATIDVANLAVTPKGATGHGHLKFGKLADLAPLLGTPLAGAIDLDIATEPNDAGKVKITLRGDRLGSGTTGVRTLQIDATVTDPMGLALADASLKADGVSGVADINRATLTVKGDMKAFDAAATVTGALTNAALAARIEPSPGEIKVALQRFDGRYRGVPVGLAAPTRARAMGARVTIDPTTLRLGGGTVRVAGVVDPAASNLTVDIAGLPLSLVDNFSPDSGVQGTLAAKAQVTGALANPRLQAAIRRPACASSGRRRRCCRRWRCRARPRWPTSALRSMQGCRPAAIPVSPSRAAAPSRKARRRRHSRSRSTARSISRPSRRRSASACATSPARCVLTSVSPSATRSPARARWRSPTRRCRCPTPVSS
jgi:hypothetical protein